MAVTLNASTSSGFVQTADTSGTLQLQNNGTTRLEANSTGVVVTGTGSVSGTLTASGNLSFNSGYGSAAVGYGCRAWVNFNGTGTIAIRGSGNVTSITDNGTGDYTVNFTTAMPDANYAVVAGGAPINNAGAENVSLAIKFGTTPTTSSVQMLAKTVGVSATDTTFGCVSIFR